MMHRPDLQSSPDAPRRTFGSQVRAFAILILSVIGLHALVLQGLAQALTGVQPVAATGPVFTARTLVLDAPRPPEPPLALAEPPQPLVQPQALRPPKPSPPAAQTAETGLPDTALRDNPAPEPTGPQSATDPVSPPLSLLAQRAAEAPTHGQTSPATPNPSPAPAGVAAVTASAGQPDYDYQVPGPARLKYKGSGTKGILSLPVSAELLWTREGRSYDARLELGLLGFSRVQTSKGVIGPRGLEPLRFGDKTRSEEAAHFQRAKGIVSFSANGPDAPLTPLAQDLLSVYMQLASMWSANPQRFRPGMQLPFQLVEKHRSGNRMFTVGATEPLKVQGREMVATRLVCEPSLDYDNRVEVWLAPALEFLPARIRMTQANGDEVDIFWNSSEKP